MKTEFPSPTCFPATDGSALKIAVIYEDFASGKRAKHFAESLAQRLGSASPPAESLWRSDLLEYPPIAAEAARAAADCDYLILALHAVRALPLAVRIWVENHIEHAARRNGGSIVLLLITGEREDSQGERWRASLGVRHQLRALCAEKDFPFFCHVSALPTDEIVANLCPPGQAPRVRPGGD